MREGALFGTMFGLGAGAVLVGVTVSRLVVGQAPERPAGGPPVVATETAPALAAETARPAKVEPPPAVVSSAAQPPAEVARERRAPPGKHRRPSVMEKTPPAPPPVADETLPSTASVPEREASTAEPPPAEVGDRPIITSDEPIAIVRGGAARPGSRAPGARIIQVEPPDGAR